MVETTQLMSSVLGESYYDIWYRWTHNWHECNALCMSYIGFEIVNLISHFVIEIHSLSGFAGGSIVLLLYSYFTVWMTMFSIFLMIGEPSMMMAPYNFRLTLFIMATISVSMYMGNVGVVIMKYLKG